MSKQILPNELAEIVVGLLLKPELFGKLDSHEKYNAFFLDIGSVVADHCGGAANWVNPGETIPGEDQSPYLYPIDSYPTLSVGPDDLHQDVGVWSYYDTEGWEGECESPIISDEKVQEVRKVLCTLPITNYDAFLK